MAGSKFEVQWRLKVGRRINEKVAQFLIMSIQMDIKIMKVDGIT